MIKTKLITEQCDEGIRLDMFVLKHFEDMSRARIKGLIEDGHILLDGKIVKSGKALKTGQEVEIDIPPTKPLGIEAEDISFEILYEDEDLLVVNKPQGLVVHPCSSSPDKTLVNGLLFRVKTLSSINGVARPGIVHRLDKNTSGVMLVAKNDFAHKNLSKQIETKECKRKYYALLEGVVSFQEKEIITDIARNPKDRKKMAVVKSGTGKIAISQMQVLKVFSKYTLAEFSLKTGRTHQIRVHAKYIGHPVVGDDIYGNKDKKFGLVGQLLHSHFIEFSHPKTKEIMRFECPLPDYFQSVLDSIK